MSEHAQQERDRKLNSIFGKTWLFKLIKMIMGGSIPPGVSATNIHSNFSPFLLFADNVALLV